MLMRILFVILLSAACGVLLAGPWIDWPFPPGQIGLVLMLAAALVLRRYWAQRATQRGDEPGEPEREVWHGLASTSLIGAQLATALYLAGPGLALHSAQASALGRTTWTLIAGAVASWFILHRREVPRDERDLAIAAHAQRLSSQVLVALVVALALLLGFTPPTWLAPMSHVFLAHLLLLSLVLASLAHHALQLWGYRDDASGRDGAG
ncbi:MAG: hypothetical protein ABT27_20215 [Lysobacteraceae bacterium SCN 69-25]|nr:MAG: hypothetical protein ABT27_20215 [Xanthomonadaceae bacterium SCN 69-25]